MVLAMVDPIRIALRRAWERRSRMIIAVGMVPLVLVLAVVGAGWNTNFEAPDRSSSVAAPVVVEVTPPLDLRPFMVLAVLAILALLVLIMRERGWTGFLIVALLALGLVGLGILGGQLDRGAKAPLDEASIDSGGRVDPDLARNPRLVLIWALIGASVVGAMLAAARRNDEPIDESDLSESVAEIAATLDMALQSPRHNIVTMYASLENRLAGGVNARAVSETTAEFSARVLHQLGASAEACAELAEVYQVVAFGERDAVSSDQLRAGELLRSISADLALSKSQRAGTDE